MKDLLYKQWGLITLGFLLIISPLFGFPRSMKSWLTSFLGAGVLFLAYRSARYVADRGMDE